MDNRTVNIVSEGDEGISLVLKLMWPSTPSGKATHYHIARYNRVTRYFQGQDGRTTHHTTTMEESERGTPTLVLLWSEEGKAQPLPFPLDLEGSIQFVQNWLKEVNYGPEPDHDGDNKKGWEIFTEAWGHVLGHRRAIVGIQPAWAMYGK